MELFLARSVFEMVWLYGDDRYWLLGVSSITRLMWKFGDVGKQFG